MYACDPRSQGRSFLAFLIFLSLFVLSGRYPCHCCFPVPPFVWSPVLIFFKITDNWESVAFFIKYEDINYLFLRKLKHAFQFFSNLFICGCAGSSLLRVGSLWLQRVEGGAWLCTACSRTGSSRGTPALGTRASAAAAPLGSAVQQQMDQTHVPCIGWQTLNRWATGVQDAVSEGRTSWPERVPGAPGGLLGAQVLLLLVRWCPLLAAHVPPGVWDLVLEPGVRFFRG